MKMPMRSEGTAKIFVKIEPLNLGFAILAQLDTGSAWSILKPEIAEAMQLMNEEGEPKRLSIHCSRPIWPANAKGPITALLPPMTVALWNWRQLYSFRQNGPVEIFWDMVELLERVKFAVDPQEIFFTLAPSALTERFRGNGKISHRAGHRQE